jgi:transposase
LSQILFRLERRVKQQVRALRRRTRDKALAMRCQIVLLADKQRLRASIGESVGCSVSWVQRVLRRFRELGVPGLYDARADNGTVKLDEHYLSLLHQTVDQSPRDYHYIRPTWTQELLAKIMAYQTGVKVHRSTMSRALHQIKARLGKPRPTVGCPWSKGRKTRRLNELQRLVDQLPKHELAFYVDEVDIHLNPKIGLDWMNRGKQKQVPTPGQNKKRYVAGALNAHTRQITWVRSERKNSLQVIALIGKLVDEHPEADVIHLILDNCKTHHSKITQAAVTTLDGKVKLHFLPPYSPDGNDIERIWLDLHANVTRNHRCSTMSELMSNVYEYLRNRNRTLKRQAKRAA